MKVSIHPDTGDHVCEHGMAVDVHCCNCHNGFIFDLDHECPDEEEVPHPFNAREESYGPSPHWCGDCEYHRDHKIHAVLSPKEEK